MVPLWKEEKFSPPSANLWSQIVRTWWCWDTECDLREDWAGYLLQWFWNHLPKAEVTVPVWQKHHLSSLDVSVNGHQRLQRKAEEPNSGFMILLGCKWLWHRQRLLSQLQCFYEFNYILLKVSRCLWDLTHVLTSLLSKDTFWSIHIHSAFLSVVLICLVLSFKSAFSILIKKQITFPMLMWLQQKLIRTWGTVRITQLPHFPGK